ncbi:hypothetical protein E3N88_46304 [Mikania micrantha]|uniref:Uncharacterized protein n=1 Tax=Mikania micrantha TaxID=192012 RepID=A0A5N6L6Y2_9ASTR|nr:hypothetical protein E3N88_46304 [Mikania micrantha]
MEEPHLFFHHTPETSDNYTLVASTSNDRNKAHLWFLDSGCSNHMTGAKESFTNLDSSFKLEVNLGDKKKLKVEGKGTVKIMMNGDRYKLLDDVYYAPKLEYNLLSVGQLMRKGYSLTFDDGECIIRNKTTGINLMAISVSNNNMFLLDASLDTGDQSNNQQLTDDQSSLWHLRYGHLNFQGLKLLSEKNMDELGVFPENQRRGIRTLQEVQGLGGKRFKPHHQGSQKRQRGRILLNRVQ